MKPAMYIVLNKGLGMSTGKAAAQAGHAAVEGYRMSLGAVPHQNCERHEQEPNLVRRWYCGGHYTKLVMEARDSEHIRDIERYLNDRGFDTALIVDEGHTETEPLVPTALAIEIVDKDDPHVAATFSSLDLYKPEPPRMDLIVVPPEMEAPHVANLRHYIAEGKPEDALSYLNAWNSLQRPCEPQRRWWWGRG